MYDIAQTPRRFRVANASDANFPSKVATVTEPTGTGSTATEAAVLHLTNNNQFVPAFIKLWPFLLGSDNDVSSLRVIGWHRAKQDTKLDLWVPTILGEFVCTASTAVGVAGSAVLNTERFCDTIVPVAARTLDQKIAAGTSTGSRYEIASQANDTPAVIVMPIFGVEKLEITFDQTTGTATGNALYSLLPFGG
jgi:hypothetical protein